MNRKGIVYSLGMVVLTLVILLMAFTYYFSEKSSLKIGDSQGEIFQTYQKVQHDLIDLDLKAKLLAIKSLYDLAENSGFSKNSGCGKYNNISLLSYKNQINEYIECLPDIEEEYEKKFKENFIKSNEKNKNNYEFFAIKNETQIQISGFALKNKQIQIGKDKNKRIISYRPSFTDKTKYNFSIYTKIIPKFIKELNNKCQNEENNKEDYTKLDNCVEDFLKEFNSANNEYNIQIYNEKNDINLLSQSFKDADSINFDDCFTIIKNPFKTTGIIYPDDRVYFKTHDEYSSIIIKKKIHDIDLKHNFYFYDDSKEIPYKKINQKYYLDVSAEILENRDDLSESYEMFGITLFNHDNDFYYVPKETYFKNQNYFLSRFCEKEKRKYSFMIKDKEIYPEEGDLNYKFSVYIKDNVNPEIEDFEIKDKEFDENALFVKWKHSLSNDVTKYEIYLNDKLIKTIIPWKSVNIYSEINWDYGNQNIFKTCNLKKDDHNFIQCYYDFNYGEGLFEDDKVYFFKENNEFVYVLNVLNKLNKLNLNLRFKIISYDDDGNKYSEEKNKLYPVDTLPYAPIKDYKIVPVPDAFMEGKYFLINYADPYSLVLGNVFENYNMDGTISEIIPEKYILYHKKNDLIQSMNNLKTYTKNEFSIGQQTIRLNQIYNLKDEVDYFLVLKDPSLENINNLSAKKFGYKSYKLPIQLNLE